MAEAAPRAPRAAAAAAARRSSPQRRPSAAGGGPRRTSGQAPFPAAFRWVRVLLLVAAVVVGLPLAHAMFGEVVALLGGATVLGFLVGRWTAPGG
jgi:hypothetical protein